MIHRHRRLLCSPLRSKPLICAPLMALCLCGGDALARVGNAAPVDAAAPSNGAASKEKERGARFYLDVGTGLGGFFATSGETTERTFRGFSPFQLSSHLGAGNRTVMAGVGLHFERIDWISAEPNFDVNGSPLLDPEGLTFTTLSLGFFARLTPPQLAGLGFGLGVFYSSMGTDRGDANDPTGLLFYGELSYDFAMTDGMAFGPVLRASYHELSVNDSGAEAYVQVFQPSLGIALRILP